MRNLRDTSGSCEEYPSERASIFPLPDGLLSAFRHAARRGRAGAAALDSAWLLLLLIPLISLSLLALRPSLWFDADLLKILLVLAAGRRWGLNAVRPTFVLCLFEIVSFMELPGFGNVWMVPTLLAACRLGAEPSFLRSLGVRRDLSVVDAVLVLTLLLGPRFIGIELRPDAGIIGRMTGMPLLFLFCILGAIQIRFRYVALYLLVGVAALWGLGPMRASSVLDGYVEYAFGVLPLDALAYCVAFTASRVARGERSWHVAVPLAAAAFWLVLLALGASGTRVVLPYGPFGVSAADLVHGTSGGSRLRTISDDLVSPSLLVAHTLLTWALFRKSRGMQWPRIWRWSAGALGIALAVLLGFALANSGFLTIDDDARSLLTRRAGTAADWFLVPHRAALLLVQCAIALVVARTIEPAPAHLRPERARRSVVLALFGPSWSIVAVLAFIAATALSLGIAIGTEEVALEEMRNHVVAQDVEELTNLSDAEVDALDEAANLLNASNLTE